MTIFDLILLICLGGFTMFGLWFGFIHTFGSLVGVLAGALISTRIFMPVGDWLTGIFGYPNLTMVIAFLIIFIIIKDSEVVSIVPKIIITGTIEIKPNKRANRLALLRSSISEVISGNNAIHTRITSVSIVSNKQIVMT